MSSSPLLDDVSQGQPPIEWPPALEGKHAGVTEAEGRDPLAVPLAWGPELGEGVLNALDRPVWGDLARLPPTYDP
jgi:hypothetical protein